MLKKLSLEKIGHVEIVNYLELVIHTESDKYQVLMYFSQKFKVSMAYQGSSVHSLESMVLTH